MNFQLLLHPLLRFWIRVASYFYFEKVEESGIENLPRDCPVIFASNHPNSFLDSLIITNCTGRSIYYTARGDIFYSPAVSKLLRFLNILPFYRREEGKEHFHKNNDTFAYCIEELKKNGAISIFSEGRCENEWDLRPLRKGTARLAYDAWNNPEIGDRLKVVPVTIQYSSWLKIKPKVYVTFLENMEKASFAGTPESGAFNKKFNDRLNALLAEKCIVIDKNRDIALQNRLIGFILKNLPDGADFAKKVQNEFLSSKNESYISLSEFLKKENIVYYTKNDVGIVSFAAVATGYLIAYILNAIPYFSCKYFIWKATKGNVYYDSLLYASLMLIYPLYLIALFSAVNHYSCIWIALSMALLTALSALFYEKFKRVIWCYLKKKKMKTLREMFFSLHHQNSNE